MSARSFVGEMSISAARSWARVRCVAVLDELVHQPADEAHGPDRLLVGHARRPEDANESDRPPGPAIWREDERDFAHIRRGVLAADDDAHLAALGDSVDE